MTTFKLQKSGLMAIATISKTEGWTVTTSTLLINVSHAESEEQAIGIIHKDLKSTRPDSLIKEITIFKCELDGNK